jgi:hypothetical protein
MKGCEVDTFHGTLLRARTAPDFSEFRVRQLSVRVNCSQHAMQAQHTLSLNVRLGR